MSDYTRSFIIDTPLGKLHVHAKQERDLPEDFPGVYVDLQKDNGEEVLLACVEYESVTQRLQTCVYKREWEDEPSDVVEHELEGGMDDAELGLR